MSKQSEAQLENKLIAQLVGLGYETVTITTSESLLRDLKRLLQQLLV